MANNPNTSLNVVIIDDEYLALDLLERHIGTLPHLKLVGKAKTAQEGMALLSNNDVDLLFLDIQMPKMSGLDFLKSMKNAPLTVFTTAYSEHALEAYNLNVVDYLLKPFAYERFLQAIDKVESMIKKESAPLPTTIDIRVAGSMVKITTSDIIYIEGLKEYIKIVTTQGQYVTYETLKHMEEVLEDHGFVRCHKSYIIAKDKVKSLEGSTLHLSDNITIPVSRVRKSAVVQKLFNRVG